MKIKIEMILLNIKAVISEIRISSLVKTIKGALVNYRDSNSSLWVTSLCYFSIMGFMPILAIFISIARFLNFDNYLMERVIENSPLDQPSLELILKTSQNVLSETRNGILASFGTVLLIFSILSMFSIIEKAFNSIWQVKNTKNFRKKIGDYFILFSALITIIFFISLVGNMEFKIEVMNILKGTAAFLGIWVFFTLFYILVPNTKVRFLYAAISSFIVTFVFNQSNYLLFTLQGFIIRHNKVYGGFSVVILFILWLKMIWFTIVIGTHITFIIQNRNLLRELNIERDINNKTKFEIILSLLKLFIINFKKDNPPYTANTLAKKTTIPQVIIEDNLLFLQENNFIMEVVNKNQNNDERLYKLSCSYDELTVKSIRDIFNNYGKTLKHKEFINLDKIKDEEKIKDL